jgi:glycosyltransferase involved in cell wall biosynthesis
LKVEVSIIIPSHNRYPLNLHTLHLLENQTFDLSKMEVILIDDASTDNTTLLKEFRPSYHFRYVRNATNMGLSRTRNLGMALARSNIVIFLDAEMIVEPDYVRKHYLHHLANEQVVVVGKNKNRVYPFLFPGLIPEQIEDICYMAEHRLMVRIRIQNKLQINLQDIDLPQYLMNLKDIVPLLDEKELKNPSRLKAFSVADRYSHNLLKQLEGRYQESRLTWLACFGSNLSFKRDIINKIGGYDESFKGWGLEDTEFAYRLHKAGAKFIVDPTLNRYHQEHPIITDTLLEEKKNMILFQQKHPDIEVCIKSLNSLKIYDFRFMDTVLEEYHSLCDKYPGQFEAFRNSILSMLKQIPVLISEKKPVENLLQSSGIGLDCKKTKRIYAERDTIHAYGKFENLVRLFHILTER